VNQPDGNQFVAEILQRSCQTFAGYAANALVESSASAASRFGADPFGDWKTHVAQRILELAAALRVGEPRIFVARVLWAQKAFHARAAGNEDLRASLHERARGGALDYLDQGLAAMAHAPGGATEPGLDPSRPNDRLALSYLQKVLSGAAVDATNELLRAVDAGLPVTSAYLEVLIAAEREIGRLWHSAQVSVAEEHMVTSAIQRTMAVILQRTPATAANGKTAIVAAIEKNAHDVGLRAAADLYQLAGWRSIFLGADVPQEDLLSMLDVFAADVLLLGVTLAPQLPRAGETIRAVRERFERRVQIIVGGAAFDEAPVLWKALGADGYAASLASVESLGARLVGLRS
jgi:methanogenic corrinoid protein MtbC1